MKYASRSEEQVKKAKAFAMQLLATADLTEDQKRQMLEDAEVMQLTWNELSQALINYIMIVKTKREESL